MSFGSPALRLHFCDTPLLAKLSNRVSELWCQRHTRNESARSQCSVTGHAPFFPSACHLGLDARFGVQDLALRGEPPVESPALAPPAAGFFFGPRAKPRLGNFVKFRKSWGPHSGNIFVRLCIAQDSGGRALLLPLPFVRRSVSYRGAVAPRVAGCPPGRFLLNFGPLASRRRSFFTVEELCCSAAVVTQINAGGIHVGPASG